MSDTYGFTPEEHKAFSEMAAADGVQIDSPPTPSAGTPADDGTPAIAPPARGPGDGLAPAAAGSSSEQPPAAPPGTPTAGQQPPAPGAQPAQKTEGQTGEEEEDDGTNVVGDPQRPEPKRVAYSKHKRIVDGLQSERATLTDQMQKMAAEKAKLEERLALIVEALQTPKGGQPNGQPQELGPMPDPNEDIIGWAAWQAKAIPQIMHTLQNLQQGHQQQQTQSREQAEFNQMNSSYRSDVMRFAQTNPDFGAAYKHLLDSRMAELRLGWGGTDEELKKFIVDEERDLVRQCLKSNRSPAEAIYGLAKLRGYQPPAVQQPAAQPGTQQTQPAPVAAPAQPAASAPAPAALPNVSEELARIRQGLGAAATLSQGGGAAPAVLTPESLLAMSDAEFGRFIDSLPEDRVRAILGN